jgi:hypothetical protein
MRATQAEAQASKSSRHKNVSQSKETDNHKRKTTTKRTIKKDQQAQNH